MLGHSGGFSPKVGLPKSFLEERLRDDTTKNQVGTIISSIQSELELPSWEPTYPSKKTLLDF